MQKKVMHVLFCDLHSAVVLADIVQSIADENIGCVSWFSDFVGRFCRATKPRPQKSADFVVHLTSPLHGSIAKHLLPSAITLSSCPKAHAHSISRRLVIMSGRLFSSTNHGATQYQYY